MHTHHHQTTYPPPAKTFPDLITLLKRHFFHVLTEIGHLWLERQPTIKWRISLQRQRQKYLDSLLSPIQEELDHPHVMGEPWQTPRDLAEQETARIVALQQLEEEKQIQTLRIRRFPTKTLMNAYNAEKRAGVPIQERTTAVIRRLSGPLSLRERASLHGTEQEDEEEEITQKRFPAVPLWNPGKAIERQGTIYLHGIRPLSLLQQEPAEEIISFDDDESDNDVCNYDTARLQTPPSVRALTRRLTQG